MSRDSRSLAFALAFALALCATTVAQETRGVVLRNLDLAGAFEITNSGPDARLSTRLRVEQLWQGAWTPFVADVDLIRACGGPPTPPCIELKSEETLRPPPWNGQSCAGQCPSACRANVLAGPGTYRFAAETCGGGQTLYGPPFARR